MIARQEKISRKSGLSNSLDNPEFLVYHFFQRDLLDAIDKYAEGNLLDIGCGNKPYASAINKKVKSYTGCDIVQSSENCVDVICEATAIPLENSSFDTVFSTQTIEHVEDHQQLVNEAYRLLKDGGHFILSGPMYWPLHEEPYDFFRFTKHGFKYILSKAGFEVVDIKSNGGKWALCGQVFMHALFPEVKRAKSMKWKMIRVFIKAAGGIKGLNKFFLKMDEGAKNESSTINYVVVARKSVPNNG